MFVPVDIETQVFVVVPVDVSVVEVTGWLPDFEVSRLELIVVVDVDVEVQLLVVCVVTGEVVLCPFVSVQVEEDT